ncbi:GGDEF domain-containing protein [Candidatus Formimonas warabiya]|uniref:Diguanylate cyclase n=1 Tax=Formimonas warabiya TaxID=1761012 RepID=A0A3G1KUN3_FORW1|nr:GGDEF domain-containing protein [Candidatus Formimonas warabiya]ATW26152.1 hypothetical protein DCMF_16475 [Candidatus Formimonas warabiya]
MLFDRIMHSAAIYKHVIENMQDGVITVDKNGIITMINPAAERILEKKRADVIEKKYSEVFFCDKENDNFNQTVLDAIYESPQVHRKIVNYYTGKKLITLFLSTSYIKMEIDKECETVGIVAVFSDITELQDLREAGKAFEQIKLLNKKLENLSYLDDLTQIPNRRYFNDTLNREWKRALRKNQFLSLIFIDIDSFKELNDHMGHQAGDKCLSEIASKLTEIVKRPGDMIARFGGDEFVAILPQTNLESARRIAQKMCQAVKNLRIKNPGSPLGIVTISVGVACAKPSLETGYGKLVTLADNALFQAKTQGRNQVCQG